VEDLLQSMVAPSENYKQPDTCITHLLNFLHSTDIYTFIYWLTSHLDAGTYSTALLTYFLGNHHSHLFTYLFLHNCHQSQCNTTQTSGRKSSKNML